MKDDNELLRFTLRGFSEEDARAFEDARRRIAAQAAAALMPTAEGLTRIYEQLAAVAVGVPRVNFEGVGTAVAQVLEESRRTGEVIGRGLAAFAEQMQESARILAESVAAMPDEDREELRRAIEDAPLCEVDVTASAVM